MSAPLADEPLPMLEAVGLVAANVGIILASFTRIRARRSMSRVAQLFWNDLSQAGYVWAGAMIALLVGGLGEVKGLRTPIWLLLAILAGLTCLPIARLRWARHAAAAARRPVDDSSRPERPRLISTSWEVALLGGGVGGLLAYGAAVSHAWGHPIPWLIAGVGVAVGYAIGLIVATPRYSVRRGST